MCRMRAYLPRYSSGVPNLCMSFTGNPSRSTQRPGEFSITSAKLIAKLFSLNFCCHSKNKLSSSMIVHYCEIFWNISQSTNGYFGPAVHSTRTLRRPRAHWWLCAVARMRTPTSPQLAALQVRFVPSPRTSFAAENILLYVNSIVLW